jgi:hypothetical protein
MGGAGILQLGVCSSAVFVQFSTNGGLAPSRSCRPKQILLLLL